MDERFKHIGRDPRFRGTRKKPKKVQVDDRFKQMFTDERFALKQSRDKRGRILNKSQGDDLRNFYSIEGEEPEELVDDKDVKERTESAKQPEIQEESSDSDTESDLDHEGSSSENEDIDETGESELSSSSDESESEQEADGDADVDVSRIRFDWQPIDHDAEHSETTSRRLAFQNLDWDHLSAKDLYTLVNSVRTPLSVKIYISEFGKERLAREEIEGPQEIAEMPKIDEEEQEYEQLKEKIEALKNPRAHKANEYEDADELIDLKNEELRERIRKYQLNRMKYYYAIAEFDSVEAAEFVYKELDGLDYEGSSLELDLRFVPDDMEFNPSDVKEECKEAPDVVTYKAPLFINSALQQTTVKFTWDETDIDRQDKLRRAYTNEELEKDDLDAYLASETDDEDEPDDEQMDSVSVVTANSEARANKYRMLLKSLEEEEERKKKVDVDIEWGDYEGDKQKTATEADDPNNPDDTDNDDEFPEDSGDQFDSEDDSVEPVVQKSVGKPNKKSEADKTNKSRSKKGKRHNKNKTPSDTELDPELALFGLDAKATAGDDFKFNPDDKRFEAVYESGLYNIDPSHPNFKRTPALEMLAERKRDRRIKKLRAE